MQTAISSLWLFFYALHIPFYFLHAPQPPVPKVMMSKVKKNTYFDNGGIIHEFESTGKGVTIDFALMSLMPPKLEGCYSAIFIVLRHVMHT